MKFLHLCSFVIILGVFLIYSQNVVIIDNQTRLKFVEIYVFKILFFVECGVVFGL